MDIVHSLDENSNWLYFTKLVSHTEPTLYQNDILQNSFEVKSFKLCQSNKLCDFIASKIVHLSYL